MKYLKTYNESNKTWDGTSPSDGSYYVLPEFYRVDLSILTDILYELSDNHNDINIVIHKDFSNFVKIESSLHDNNQIKDEINSLIKRALKYYYQETGVSLSATIHDNNFKFFYSNKYMPGDAHYQLNIEDDLKVDRVLYVYFSQKNDKPNVFSNQSLNFKIEESRLTNMFSEEDINDIKDIFQDIIDEFNLNKDDENYYERSVRSCVDKNTYKINFYSNEVPIKIIKKYHEYYINQITIKINFEPKGNIDLYEKMIDDFMNRLYNMGFVVSEKSHRFSTDKQKNNIINHDNDSIVKYIDIWKK